MSKNLNLNVLQDYIDMFGGRFKLSVKWHKGNIYLEEDEETQAGLVYFTQIPLSANADNEMKEAILDKMPNVGKVIVNNSVEVTQNGAESNKINMQNKFNQSMDFEIELNHKKPAEIKAYTYLGIRRLEHDYTYVRALFTTNPYFAVIFNGIRIVPYNRDLDALGKNVIQAIQKFAKESIPAVGEEAALAFKVEKAFEVTFYLGKQDVTQDIHRIMSKQKESQTSLDEFGFLAYIALYQIFNGELNNSMALNKL